MIKKFLFFWGLCFLFFSISFSYGVESDIKFSKSFGFCPTKMSGEFVKALFDEFKLTKSLKILKKKIVDEDLQRKNFLSEYKIEYGPVLNHLTIKIDCPRPLLKVKITSLQNKEKEQGILVDNGQIFDPTYEVFLKSDNKIKGKIPEFSIVDDKFNKINLMGLTNFLSMMPGFIYENLSEVYFDDDQNLNLILSSSKEPLLVLMGEQNWEIKLAKLEKIMRFFVSQEKIPFLVNLSDYKKVVVKFPSKF